jgi:hypothetical protein
MQQAAAGGGRERDHMAMIFEVLAAIPELGAQIEAFVLADGVP